MNYNENTHHELDGRDLLLLRPELFTLNTLVDLPFIELNNSNINKAHHHYHHQLSSPSDQNSVWSDYYHHLTSHPTELQTQLNTSSLNFNNNLDPLLSTTPNSIDCWIDFTGGNSSSSSSSSSDGSHSTIASPTGSTGQATSLEPLPLIVDQQPWIYPLPPPPPPPPGSATQDDASQAAQSDSCKGQLTKDLQPARQTESSSPCPPACPSSPTPSSSSLTTTSTTYEPQTGSKNKKKKRNNTKSSARKKSEARNEFLERNRLAASRSRAKKKSYQQFLEDQARRLEEEQVRLKEIILELVSEKEQLKRLLDQHH